MRNVILCSVAVLFLSTSVGVAAENFKFKSQPEYSEGEGQRGYSAEIIPAGSRKVYFITSTCEYYDPKMPAYEVTWYDLDNTPMNFRFESINHRFVDVDSNATRIPMEFYKLTCGSDKRFKKYLKNPDKDENWDISR